MFSRGCKKFIHNVKSDSYRQTVERLAMNFDPEPV